MMAADAQMLDERKIAADAQMKDGRRCPQMCRWKMKER